MFDYLGYKNKIPIKECLIDIPRINPLSIGYERFWFNTIKRKQIEGHWVNYEGNYQWMPGTIFQYVNLWNIEMKKATGASKGKVIGRPRLRDLEWIKGFIHAVARGFSGFKDDEEYSCHRVLLNPDFDEFVEYLAPDAKASLYKPNGSLKTYVDALEYLYTYKDRELGKPFYFNYAKNVIEIGARNYGKDIHEDSLLHTSNGTIKIKDINIGDSIYDNSGKLTKVKDKVKFEDQLQYEVTLQDGRVIKCGGGHKWGVYHRTKYKVVDLNYILSTNYKTMRKNGYPEYSFRIPLTSPVDLPEKELELEPYFLGLWLGDGHNRTASITNIDQEIIDYLYDYGDRLNLKLRSYKQSYFYSGKTHNSNTILHKLKELNLIQNKHIPEHYLNGSIEQRLELLRGLMDSDGFICKNGHSEFSNKHKPLADDFMKLCYSLGITVRRTERTVSCIYKGERKYSQSHRITMNTDLEIFKLTRKKERLKEAKSTKRNTSMTTVAIIDIKPIAIEPSYCIEVDNNSHLFLANDYIVTHNSMFSGNICGHNFLTDGITDFDEWWSNRQLPSDMQEKFTTQTLLAASDSKYVNNLSKHLRTGLDSLPGKMELGGKLYPAPLSKQVAGSWIVGKDIIAKYDEKVGGRWITKGSGSGYLLRSFKDNPYAANGSRYGLGLLDEIGFMDNVEDVLGQLHECTTVDGEKYGTIWMTGTGGAMTSGATAGAKRVFYDPAAQDCLEFDDQFENKGKIGLFIPAWMALDEFRDPLGNINKELALKKLLKEREVARNAKSKKPLYDLLQMKPLVPSEAFLVMEGNIFPTAELKEHLSELESSEKLKDLGTTGWMERESTGKAYFKVDHSLIPCDYPTRDSIDLKGAVVIWEQPIEKIPYGLYVAGIDPYDQDQAESSPSLGSIIIYKRFINAGQTYHLPVAEYSGRPEFANDFYEQCRRLLEYYNAIALYENEKTGIKSYFEMKQCLHLLARQPSIIKSISPNSKVDRTYGTHMTKQIKDSIEIMTRDWLKTEIEPGIMQLTKIKSIPLLKELIVYNQDINTDRAIAFMLVVMQDLQLHLVTSEEVKEEIVDNFFTRKLFI